MDIEDARLPIVGMNPQSCNCGNGNILTGLNSPLYGRRVTGRPLSETNRVLWTAIHIAMCESSSVRVSTSSAYGFDAETQEPSLTKREQGEGDGLAS
jgi:hypothetical protein